MEGVRTVSRAYADRGDVARIKLITLKFLRDQVQNAKGNLVTFRPSKVAHELDLYGRGDMRAVTVMIRAFLDHLVQSGYITVIKRSARGKVYGIHKSGRLWDLLVAHEPEQILEIIEDERFR